MRKLAGIGLATIALGSLMFMGLQGVANAGSTNTTFTVTGGSLSITVPASTVNLGSGGSGSSISHALGNVTVNDARGNIAATWTSVAASTNFTGSTYVTQTISAAAVNYAPGSASAPSGIAASFVAGPGGAMSSGGQTAFTGSAIGSNSVTWDPTLTVSVPSTAVADTYTGTVTHTVS